MQSIKYLIFMIIATIYISCSRTDENDDVLSQEDISNIIFHVKDDVTGVSADYNYTVNSATNPIIKLVDGKIYTVTIDFKNGNENATQEIINAIDEHFFIFNFHGSQINLTREDDILRSDGKKVGFKTKWEVIKAVNSSSPNLEFTVIHDASAVTEEANGSTYGTAEGGETDAMAIFGISN